MFFMHCLLYFVILVSEQVQYQKGVFSGVHSYVVAVLFYSPVSGTVSTLGWDGMVYSPYESYVCTCSHEGLVSCASKQRLFDE